ncbi:hypothetical protein GBAR_LOCUS30342 [Geodia barretti]|uniref:DUF1549 domain-containing protein n=1 Tax=Geodia barretti TaxID=519541 RepID=A0AA35TW69_GEOBA|nr:hypothetical protein GBAR_LOCUS30342 [Geodia barretti]
MSACYSLFLFAFAFLVFSCTKTTVAPTRQVSSSTKHLDRYINAALKRESIQPSKMSEDAEFLRRVHLDLTGKIPTPEEVLDFLKDGSSNKRQKKIDLLLDSDVYLDYWSGLWVNWLIGRREDGDDRRIGLTFWVRDALTKNMPYNQFVQELIAADGELRDNGAGNYIMRYERSPVFLTSHTSRLFLGLPMQCAECHDHKTEVWSQEDFYGVAAFFAGIDSQRKGDIETMDMAGNERKMDNFLITNKPENSIWVERLEKQVRPHFLGGTEYKGSLLKKREALAQWMTDKSNPYFSQAIVNRIWQRFMGRAFVEPVDGFGEENQSTNPELLKSLAKDFVIYSYDLQHLMRTILNSEAYQRTSQTNESNKDDQLYYSHAYVKPLSAEQFFYSVLQATGFERLQQVRMKGSKKQGGEDRKGMLRQLERMKREHLKKFLFLLDNGEMEEIEAFNGTIPQALMMINGDMVNDSASHEARGGFVNYVLEKWRGPIERVEYIYLNILSRLPTAKEKTYFRRYLERSLYRNKDLAYEDLYWVLLNSAEFSLNH